MSFMGEETIISISGRAGYPPMTQSGSSGRETDVLYLFFQIQTKGTSLGRIGKNKEASWPQSDFNTQEAVRIGKSSGASSQKVCRSP